MDAKREMPIEDFEKITLDKLAKKKSKQFGISSYCKDREIKDLELERVIQKGEINDAEQFIKATFDAVQKEITFKQLATIGIQPNEKKKKIKAISESVKKTLELMLQEDAPDLYSISALMAEYSQKNTIPKITSTEIVEVSIAYLYSLEEYNKQIVDGALAHYPYVLVRDLKAIFLKFITAKNLKASPNADSPFWEYVKVGLKLSGQEMEDPTSVIKRALGIHRKTEK